MPTTEDRLADHENRIRELEEKVKQIEKERAKEKEDARRMRKLR